MQWKNNSERFGLVAQWLHWLVAIGIIGAYVAMFYKHEFTEKKTPENLFAMQMHISFGLSVLSLMVLRILSRLMQPVPKPAPGSRHEQMAARWMHWGLILFAIAMPLTGYLSTGLDPEIFTLFTLPKFGDTAAWAWLSQSFALDMEALEEPLHAFHHFVGEWVLWLLVLGHSGAALFHHFVRKDNVLRRMVPGWPNRPE